MLVKLNKNLILEDADVKNTDKDKEDELYRKKALEIGLTSADPKMDRRQIDREHELFTKANDLRNEQNRLNKDNMKLNPEQERALKQAEFNYYDVQQKRKNPSYRVATNPVIITGLGTLAGGLTGYSLADDESLNGYGNDLATVLGAGVGGALSYAAAQQNIPGKIIKSNVIPNTYNNVTSKFKK